MNPSIKEIVVQTNRISLLRGIRRGHHITELKTLILRLYSRKLSKQTRSHIAISFLLFVLFLSFILHENTEHTYMNTFQEFRHDKLDGIRFTWKLGI